MAHNLRDVLLSDVAVRTELRRGEDGDVDWAGVRVGVDLVAVDDVAAAVRAFGDRYLTRIFTAQEIASCPGVARVRAEGLAARFAAKEATMKVLRPADLSVPWTSIEVVRHPQGWCGLSLQGAARRAADDAGLSRFALSLSHEAGMAAAVVVAHAGAVSRPRGARWTRRSGRS